MSLTLLLSTSIDSVCPQLLKLKLALDVPNKLATEWMCAGSLKAAVHLIRSRTSGAIRGLARLRTRWCGNFCLFYFWYLCFCHFILRLKITLAFRGLNTWQLAKKQRKYAIVISLWMQHIQNYTQDFLNAYLVSCLLSCDVYCFKRKRTICCWQKGTVRF